MKTLREIFGISEAMDFRSMSDADLKHELIQLGDMVQPQFKQSVAGLIGAVIDRWIDEPGSDERGMLQIKRSNRTKVNAGPWDTSRSDDGSMMIAPRKKR